MIRTRLRAVLVVLAATVLLYGVFPAAAHDDEPVQITKIDPAALPTGVRAAVLARVPGMNIVEVQRKQRDGRVYFDVEGLRADGSEVELDLLQTGDTFEVVEMQRDLAWAEVPAAVRDAAMAASEAFEPERVIESTQNDGSIIYELFAPGKPADPAREIRWHNGKADVLSERWQH